MENIKERKAEVIFRKSRDIYNWMEDHLNRLLLLESDHKLIVEDGYKINFAIDFTNIYNFAFPYIHLKNCLENSRYKENKELIDALSLELHANFALLYSTPTLKAPILLPPYEKELQSTFTFYQRMQNRVPSSGKLVISVMTEKARREFKDIEKSKLDKWEDKQIFDILIEHFNEFTWLLLGSCADGVKVIKNLLKDKRLKTNISRWDEKLIGTTIKEFFGSQTINKEPIIGDYFNLFNKFRSAPKEKYYEYSRTRQANLNDSIALAMVKNLNDLLVPEKEIVLLASSAHVVRKVVNKINKTKPILNIPDLPDTYNNVLRDHETFATYLFFQPNIEFNIVRKWDEDQQLDYNRETLKNLKEAIIDAKQKLNECQIIMDYAKEIQKTCTCKEIAANAPNIRYCEIKCERKKVCTWSIDTLEEIQQLRRKFVNTKLLESNQKQFIQHYEKIFPKHRDSRFSYKKSINKIIMLLQHDDGNKIHEYIQQKQQELHQGIDQLRMFFPANLSPFIHKPDDNLIAEVSLVPFMINFRTELLNVALKGITHQVQLVTKEETNQKREKLSEKLSKKLQSISELIIDNKEIKIEEKILIAAIFRLFYDNHPTNSQVLLNSLLQMDKDIRWRREATYLSIRLLSIKNNFDKCFYKCIKAIEDWPSDTRFYHLLSYIYGKQIVSNNLKFEKIKLDLVFNKCNEGIELLIGTGNQNPDLLGRLYNNLAWYCALLEQEDYYKKGIQLLGELEKTISKKNWPAEYWETSAFLKNKIIDSEDKPKKKDIVIVNNEYEKALSKVLKGTITKKVLKINYEKFYQKNKLILLPAKINTKL